HRQNNGTPTRVLPETPAVWLADRRDDRPLRWPSNAVRIPAASPARHPGRQTLHTNRPVPRRPSRSSAERRSHAEPVPAPLRGVALLARRLAIRFQNRIDELRGRSHLHVRTLRLLPPRRYRALNRLPHQPPVYAQFPRHALNRTYPKLIFQPNLLE